MYSKVDEDVPLIATFLFIVLWTGWYKFSEDISDSIIFSLIVTLLGVGIYKIIRFVWKKQD